uniref:Peroxin/Ferlin domain-containing protein n=2 Tax=Mesocestoides corti TaxID=53468 RepID=A0A5K3FAZ8_MESCO
LTQPERYLWSCDDQGNAYYLSSWEAGWRTLRVRNGHQLRVKRLVASSWCVWAISADQSPYLFVPSDGTVTRVTELISQHERWKPSSGFSASNLLSSDPPEYHQVGHESSSWTSLPSTRWQWESKNWEFVLHHSEGGAGWEYSTSFSPNASFSSFYRCGCVVRRRRWQRVRRFLGHDRWLLCCVCSNELESDAEQRNSPSGIVHVYQLAIGGEAIPYQPLGFLLLWAVTRDGRVIFRSDLRRDNPEGTKWVESCLLMVYQQNSKKARPQTHQPFAIDIHVNQHGHVLVLTDDNQIFHRVGVSWKNPYGTSWQLLTCESPPLQDHEHLVSVGLGRRSAWILANTGRCWFRADFNCGGLPSDPHRRWSAMAGRLKALSVSPTDQVFALDRLSNRLIYRSGITPATPGGEAWISLDLPILPGLNCVSEGPRSSFCPSQDEALQLVARLVQLTNPSSDDSFDENFEHCSIPEDIDVNAEALLPQAPPAHVLGRKLRRLFSSRSRTQTHGFFESFRHLLKDALDDRGDATRPVVDRAMPRIGHPPVNLAVLWAGAVSRPDATLPPELPHRWRVSALISEKKQLIPYFTIDDPLSPPDWYKQIGSALSEELPRVFEGSNSLPKVINSNEGSNQEPWTDSFAVDVLRLSPNPSTERRRVEWLRGQAVVTHTALENHHPEFLVTYPPPDSHCSVSDDWLETHSNDQTSEKLNGDEVAWAGYVGALSTLIPRTWKDAGAGGRRKFVEHVPFKKPGSVNLTDRGRRQSSPLNHAPPSSTGRLVAVFARRASSTSSVDSVTAAEATAEGGSVCGDAASARRHAVPRWILRFSSAAEASAWLKNTQKLTTLMPSTGKIWMVTEQAEVFWAASRNVETASWTKVRVCRVKFTSTTKTPSASRHIKFTNGATSHSSNGGKQPWSSDSSEIRG